MQDPGTYDFTIYQGASFDRVFTWQTGTPSANVNLTGYTSRMQLRTSVTASPSVLDLNTANGGIVLGGVAGTISVSITAAATASLSPGYYVYDLEMVSGATVVRLLEGRVTVSAEVTR